MSTQVGQLPFPTNLKTLKSHLKKLYEKSWTYDAYNYFWIFWGMAAYRFINKTPEKSKLAGVNLFCKTQGKASDFIHSLIASFNRPYDAKGYTGYLGDLDETQVDQIVAQIKRDGFYISPKKLPNKICDQLLQYALETDFNTVGEKPGYSIKYDRKNPIAIRYGIHPEKLLNHPIIQDIVSDHSFLQVAQKYLNCAPVLDLVGLVWNTDFSKEPSSDAATMFHFDWNGVAFLKVFIYLTDVTTETGPHTFVKGTHKTGAIPNKFLKRKYQRIPDQEIEEHYGKDRVVEFTLPRGSILLEDTRGFHKAKHNVKGDRLVLQTAYIDSPFGGYVQPGLIKAIHNKNFGEILEKWPRFFTQFK